MDLLDKLLRRKKGHLHPGDRCPEGGQYTYSKQLKGRHIQRGCEEGETMPPPPLGLEGGWWKLTDRTRH